MVINMKSVITEKYKKWNYIDKSGLFVWINRYGDIIKKEDLNGEVYGTMSISWNVEAAEGLANIHGVDFQFEMEQMLAIEIQKQINNDIIKERFNLPETEIKTIDINHIEFNRTENMIKTTLRVQK